MTSDTITKGARTKSLILDAAETLFADMGYDGVSMRTVAERAEVHLGMLTYHFPSKEALFDAVIARRAGTLTDARRKAVDLLTDPSLEELIGAFIRPYRDFVNNGGLGWRAYGRLIAHTSQEARWTKLVAQYFGGFGHEMINRIMATEPRLNRDQATRGYVHLISLMMGTFASTRLLDNFSHGNLRSEDVSASYEPLLTFAVAGIRAMANQYCGSDVTASAVGKEERDETFG